jgi:hypothetical protein
MIQKFEEILRAALAAWPQSTGNSMQMQYQCIVKSAAQNIRSRALSSSPSSLASPILTPKSASWFKQHTSIVKRSNFKLEFRQQVYTGWRKSDELLASDQKDADVMLDNRCYFNSWRKSSSVIPICFRIS